MSNLIPPLVSSSPPPMVTDEPDDLDDEFGDFTAATDLSFEGYSLPTTPQHASFSNFSSTQTNLIISHKIKNNLETNKSSENIFCDIKDVNTTFVNNNKETDIIGSINQNVQNVEVSVPRITENDTKFTGLKDNVNDDFGDFNSFPDCNSAEKVESSNENHLNNESDLYEFKEVINDVNESTNSNGSLKVLDNNDETAAKNILSENTETNPDVPSCIDNICSTICIEEISTTTDDFESNLVKENTNNFEISSYIATEEINTEKITQSNGDTSITSIETIEKNNLKTFETGKDKSENTLCNEETHKTEEFTLDEIKNEEKDKDFRNSSSVIINEKMGENEVKNAETDDEFGNFKCRTKLEEFVVDSTRNLEKESEDNSGNITSIAKDTHAIENTEKFLAEDDFGEFDFNSKVEEIKESLGEDLGDFDVISKIQTTNLQEISDDDFSDFKSDVQTKTDDFEDFVSIGQLKDDDFGDFNDYIHEEKHDFPTNFNTDSVANAEKVIQELFTDKDTKLEEIQVVNFSENNIFKQIQDIENTSALSYQWANSESQKTLLKALNIDSRNILFGPRWNASMPRFAANLGFTPLEPVKTELPANGASSSCIAGSETRSEVSEVPAAKFDWTSSGLTNPLDYSQASTMLLDLEQFSLDIPNISLSQNQNQEETLNLDMDSWDLWLQTQSEPIKQETIEDKLSINEERRNSEHNAPIHLDLNILNNFGSDNESVNSLKFIEAPDVENELKIEQKTETYSNFQFVKSESTWTSLVPQKIEIKESHISFESENKNLNIQEFDLESTIVTPELSRKDLNIPEQEEEEFADFQMSLPQEPVKTTKKSEYISPVPLEPLKPIVLEPSVINSTPTQINWPEPGIICEDISEFEFAYCQEKTEDIPKVELKEKKKEEEDDWSDFVCAEQPKTQNYNTSQNSLELSVPNLSQLSHKNTFIPNISPTKSPNQTAYNIHLNYQPYQIPLQTINTPFGGLPQTSLSSYNNFTIGPTELSQNLPKKEFGIFDGPFNSEIKPFQNSSNYQNPSVKSSFLEMQSPKENLGAKDDDEWTDFLSSQPVNQNLNGFSQQKSSTNFNIIANPVHFDAFQSYQSSTADKNARRSNQKSSVPSISALPELDFIAPKNKFFSKK